MIFLAREECLGFQVGNVNVRGSELSLQFFQEVFPLLGICLFLDKVDIGLQVTTYRHELFVRGNLLFGAFAFAQNSLGGFLVVPEIGFGNARLQRFQAFAVARCVKDSSGRA